MRQMRTVVLMGLVVGLCLLLAAPLMAQGPRPMEMDVYTPLVKGYDFVREGKYDAAEVEFKKALLKDTRNPFALNNLAAIAAQKGDLKKAMAYLKDAEADAPKYMDDIVDVCFVAGLCNAVKPTQKLGTESKIAKTVKENIAKLEAKMKATPAPPQPATPPAMDIKKPEKEKGK